MSAGPLAAVRSSYGARATDYIEAVGSIAHVDPADLALIETWSRGIDGRVLDVGCGPGQWTHFLTSLGVTAEGIDPVPEFVDSARTTYPDDRYRLGRAEELGVDDDTIGGVLAWYSLIHTDPEQIGDPLAEFARCIRPGGCLALGFFTGARLEPFEHAVTTAYYWPIDLLAGHVETAGFTITHTESRADRPTRSHAAILATR